MNRIYVLIKSVKTYRPGNLGSLLINCGRRGSVTPIYYQTIFAEIVFMFITVIKKKLKNYFKPIIRANQMTENINYILILQY